MPLVIINATTAEDTKAQIVKVVEEFGPSLKGSNNVGLVIDGHVCLVDIIFISVTVLCTGYACVCF